MKNATLTNFLPWVIGLLVFNALFRKSAQAEALNNAPTDNNSQLAIQLRQALNPSGAGWLMGSDGTDEDALFSLAPQLRGGIFQAVAQRYELLYRSNLTTDLQNELSAPDLQKFWALVNGSSIPTTPTPSTSGNTGTGTPPRANGKKVVATKVYNIRDYENPQKVIKQSKVGETIGVYDGERIVKLNGVDTAFYVAKVSFSVPIGIFSVPRSLKYLIAKGGARLV